MVLSVKISKFKIKFQKIIDLVYSNKALAKAVFNEVQEDRFKKKEIFSIIDDLQIIHALINKNQDFEIDNWCTEIPELKNTSVYRRRKSNPYFVGRLKRICSRWTPQHIEALYEYLRDHSEEDLQKVRSMNIISKCKCVKLRRNKEDEKEVEVEYTKKKEKKHCFFRWRKEDFNIFFDNNLKGLEFDALSINTESQQNSKKNDITNLMIIKNLKKNIRKITEMPDQNTKDYNSFFHFVSHKYKIEDEKIIKELLEKVNDNRENLIQFLDTKDEKLLWNEKEDDIIRGLKSRDDFFLKLLCGYKGIESVRERVKFKSINLSFKI